jgi:hypothetical protein
MCDFDLRDGVIPLRSPDTDVVCGFASTAATGSQTIYYLLHTLINAAMLLFLSHCAVCY